MAMILFGLSVTVYSQEIFNSNDYYSMFDIGGYYDGSDFHFDLMGSYSFYFDIFGSLHIRPEIDIFSKQETLYEANGYGESRADFDSIYAGLHLSALYGYDIGLDFANVFLYGGLGFGYNAFLNSTETGSSSGSGYSTGYDSYDTRKNSAGWAVNYIFGAKLLFSHYGAYIEYKGSFLGDGGRLSAGLTFALGGSASRPKPPPRTNNDNRDRDYF
jgi:hypothetical protein